MKTLSITKHEARLITDELRALLTPWAEARGLELKLGGGSFTNMSYKPRFELLVAANADGKSKSQIDFEMCANAFGLKASDYGQSYREGAHTFTVVGVNLKARGFRIEVRRDDNKLFRASGQYVATMLQKEVR